LYTATTSHSCLGVFPKDRKVRVIANNKSDTNCKSLACSVAKLYHRSACTSARNVAITHSIYNLIFLTLTMECTNFSVGVVYRRTQIATH